MDKVESSKAQADRLSDQAVDVMFAPPDPSRKVKSLAPAALPNLAALGESPTAVIPGPVSNSSIGVHAIAEVDSSIQGLSIRFKFIITSTLLVLMIIAFFSVMNNIKYRSIIGQYSMLLSDSIRNGLEKAGIAQLQLLAQATRQPMAQNDFIALQAIVRNIAKDDSRVTMVAVVDEFGTIVAHNDSQRLRKKAEGLLATPISSNTPLKSFSNVAVDAQQSMAFAMPVLVDQRAICKVFLAYSLKPLNSELQKAGIIKRQVIASFFKYTGILSLFALVVGLMLATFQGHRISTPIKQLAQHAFNIASGDLNARTEITSRDEIGALGRHFNYMANRVKRLLAKVKSEAQEKAIMTQELEIASAVQATLLPKESNVDIPGLQFSGYYKPASQCGGDWWNYYTLVDGRILIIVGDVTGHGIGSAMITAAAKGAASSFMVNNDNHFLLNNLLKSMNVAIHDSGQRSFVMTCFASILDLKRGTITYANAGHNFPYICCNQKEIRVLLARGNRLGDLLTSEYATFEHPLNKGDAIIWFTDGLVECENTQGEMYGDRRLRKLFKRSYGMEAEQLLGKIIKDTSAFYAEQPQKDDITIVVGKIT